MMKAFASLLLLSTTAVTAQPFPIPKPSGGTNCPTGYYASGNYCVPTSDRSRPAIPMVGPGTNCPTGYYASGSACLKN
jgi:S-formylglutathione hydrolase FrmB